jgi:hypothetical protein
MNIGQLHAVKYKQSLLEEFLETGGHSTACTTVVGNATKWAANLITELENKGIKEVVDT